MFSYISLAFYNTLFERYVKKFTLLSCLYDAKLS